MAKKNSSYTGLRIYFQSLEQKNAYRRLVEAAASDMQKRILAFLTLDLAFFKATNQILPLDLSNWINRQARSPAPQPPQEENAISRWVNLWDFEVLAQKSFIPLERVIDIAAGGKPDCGELSKLFRIGLSSEKIKILLGDNNHNEQHIDH